jgi:hypothetical protein
MITLENAWIGDIETLPNCFTLAVEMLHTDVSSVWEISEFRDDRTAMLTFLSWATQQQAPFVSFNGISFDYPVLHYVMHNPTVAVEQIYTKAMSCIEGDRFANTIWANDRAFPSIDVYRINHFDNKAKTTSLKALQINMRSPTVVDSPVQWGTRLTREEIDRHLIPYNIHDVRETKRFTFHCMDAINFRLGLVDQFGPDVLNYNDTKIGAKILEQRLGEDVCYERIPRWDGDNYGRKAPRQTPRWRIALNDIIFPYVQFQHPEFQRVLDYMRAQVLTPEDLEDPEATIKTKGVFSELKAHVGGIDFHFGTGGIHGSVEAQRIIADDTWLTKDIDVEGLYPSIAIVNRLAPEHLGAAFVEEYAKLPIERKKHAKGTVQNASFKLASNGTYGNSNNKFSVFYDPKFTMTITINGQLMLCMLAEWLLAVPTIQLIQINTDGITYRIHADYEPMALEIQARWEAYTCLKLERADYSRMWIRDVNNYVAEDMKGKLKQKGAYWHPTPGEDYAKSISTASPPAWHKDLGNVVSIRAAIAAMTSGVDPETFIRAHTDPFDFMCRVKVGKSDKLLLGGQEIQRTTRYYVARQGAPLRKISPPPKGAEVGQFKRASKLSDATYNAVMAEIGPGVWDARIHTKNKSMYEMRETGIEAGWNVAECNDAASFRFDNIEYGFYVAEARKLIIG